MNTYPNAYYPRTIDNGHTEKLTYLRYVENGKGGRLECENEVAPNGGPPMHVHWLQEEGFTVVEGRMGVEILGQEKQYYGPGDTAVFKAGEYHRFWNAGDTPLRCAGWVEPALNFEYFLTNIYASIKSNGGERPESFDAAFLLGRYRAEFDMLSIPKFVKKAVFPVIRFVGKVRGKYRKFANAPKPLA